MNILRINIIYLYGLNKINFLEAFEKALAKPGHP